MSALASVEYRLASWGPYKKLVARWQDWRPWPTRRLLLVYQLVTVAVVGAGIWAIVSFAHPASNGCSHLVCDVNTNLAASAIVAAAGLLAFVVRTRVWVLSRYLHEARAHPERLVWPLGHGPRLEEIARRRDLCRDLIRELCTDARNVPMVVGDAGSGKTTLMAALAADLARRGAVPVYVQLRGARVPFDLPDLARRCFLRHVKDRLVSESAGDRLWRYVWRWRLVVILADGLDEALAPTDVLNASEFAAGALDARGRGPGRVVVASRSSAVGPGYTVFALEPLTGEQSARLIQDRLDKVEVKEENARDLATGAVTAAGVTATPFYLHVIARLLEIEGRADALRETAAKARSQDRIRADLLGRYVKASVTAHEQELTGNPSKQLRDLADLAYEMSSAGTLELASTDGEAPAAPASLIAFGRHLELLAIARGSQQTFRFIHPILQAYFASRALVGGGGEARWKSAVGRGDVSDELLEALVLTAGGDGLDGLPPRPSQDDVCPVLLACVAGLDVAEALRLLAFAVRAAATDPNARQAASVLERIPTVWAKRGDAAVDRSGGPRAALVDAVADLCRSMADVAEVGYRLLWDLEDGQRYAVAWRIVETFAGAGSEGYGEIRAKARKLIDDSVATEPAKLDERLTIPLLSTLAKFLPGVVATYADRNDPALAMASADLDTLMALVRRMTAEGVGIGTEASLFQGFKHAASLPGAAVLDGRLNELITGGGAGEGASKAKFWYSRLNGYQALARRGIEEARSRRSRGTIVAFKQELEAHATNDPHLFARHAGALCGKALRAASRALVDRAESSVWGDEALEVSRSGVHLAPDASRLLADVVLELNMNEQNRIDGVRMKRVDVPEEGGDRVGTSPEVPACLSTCANRDRILDWSSPDACEAPCRFHLCPYDPTTRLGRAHRGLSRSFCRHQQRLARSRRRRLLELLGLDASAGLAWQKSMKARTLDDFWQEMQRRADHAN